MTARTLQSVDYFTIVLPFLIPAKFYTFKTNNSRVNHAFQTWSSLARFELETQLNMSRAGLRQPRGGIICICLIKI